MCYVFGLLEHMLYPVEHTVDWYLLVGQVMFCYLSFKVSADMYYILSNLQDDFGHSSTLAFFNSHFAWTVISMVISNALHTLREFMAKVLSITIPLTVGTLCYINLSMSWLKCHDTFISSFMVYKSLFCLF